MQKQKFTLKINLDINEDKFVVISRLSISVTIIIIFNNLCKTLVNVSYYLTIFLSYHVHFLLFMLHVETLGTDSGFTELSDESKSASISPATTNLTSMPSRIDSTSDDIGCP